jgi:hypothetical protein
MKVNLNGTAAKGYYHNVSVHNLKFIQNDPVQFCWCPFPHVAGLIGFYKGGLKSFTSSAIFFIKVTKTG